MFILLSYTAPASASSDEGLDGKTAESKDETSAKADDSISIAEFAEKKIAFPNQVLSCNSMPAAR